MNKQDNSSVFSRIRKAYGWIIFGKGSGMLLTIFYTPIIITQLGNNYGLIAVGSLISYFMQTLIDAVSAWTYNHESKKNINNKTSKGASLNFHLITLTVLVITMIWTLTIIFLASSINNKFEIDSNLLILFLSALGLAQISTFLVQQFEVLNYVKHSFYILQRVGVIRKWIGVAAVLLYFYFQSEIIIETIIIAHFIESVFIFILYRKFFINYNLQNFDFNLFLKGLLDDNFFRFLFSHIFSGTSIYFVLFGFSYLVTAFYDGAYISGAAAVMVIFNTIILFASFLTKPLLSLLSENFYNELDVEKSFIKSGKDLLIKKIFNISLFFSLISFVAILFFGDAVLNLWLGGLHSEFYSLLIICSCAYVVIIPSRAVSYALLFSGKMFLPAFLTYIISAIVYLYIFINPSDNLENVAFIYVIGSGISCLASSSIALKYADVDSKKLIFSGILMTLSLASCLLCLSSTYSIKYSGLSIILLLLILILIKERKSVTWLVALIR